MFNYCVINIASSFESLHTIEPWCSSLIIFRAIIIKQYISFVKLLGSWAKGT